MQTTETVTNKGAADTIPAANMAEYTSGSPLALASSARRVSAATARTRGDLEKVLSNSAIVTSNKIKTEEELLDYSDLEDDEGCLDSSDNAEKMDTSSNVFDESEATWRRRCSQVVVVTQVATQLPVRTLLAKTTCARESV